jgi:hypothetical protein
LQPLFFIFWWYGFLLAQYLLHVLLLITYSTSSISVFLFVFFGRFVGLYRSNSLNGQSLSCYFLIGLLLFFRTLH